MEVVTRHIKYVFIDIVGYSERRTVEAQTDIIEVINRLVKSTVHHVMPEKDVIYIPTGDGICIAITDQDSPYDAHLLISKHLLEALVDYNLTMKDEMRQVQIRIGVNENVDNLVTDINGNRNIAGAGINTAQRVMNLAAGGTVIVGESVFEVLRHREAYQHNFKKYTAVVKHDVVLTVYQYLNSSWRGLICTPPYSLAHEEDVIDSRLRQCLTDAGRSGAEPHCFRMASRSWQESIEKESMMIVLTLKHPRIPQGSLEKLLLEAQRLLKDYCDILDILHDRNEADYMKTLALLPWEVSLQKSFVLELRRLKRFCSPLLPHARKDLEE